MSDRTADPPEPLPTFRYHPDPVATGSIERSDATCAACGRARGWRYTGLVYCPDEVDHVCPWCIADGSAAARLDANFADAGVEVPDDVPRAVLDEVSERTPGYVAWQTNRWMYHCGDGAAFLGLAGWPELQAHPGAIDVLLHEHDQYGWSPEESLEFVEGLGIDHDATAYLFRCQQCGAELAYSDMS